MARPGRAPIVADYVNGKLLVDYESHNPFADTTS